LLSHDFSLSHSFLTDIFFSFGLPQLLKNSCRAVTERFIDNPGSLPPALTCTPFFFGPYSAALSQRGEKESSREREKEKGTKPQEREAAREGGGRERARLRKRARRKERERESAREEESEKETESTRERKKEREKGPKREISRELHRAACDMTHI